MHNFTEPDQGRHVVRLRVEKNMRSLALATILDGSSSSERLTTSRIPPGRYAIEHCQDENRDVKQELEQSIAIDVSKH